MEKHIEILKENGLKVTPQRLEIFKVIEECAGLHPSAEEICGRVRKKHPSLSLTTVYRTLEILAAAGYVKELSFSNGKTLFDGFTKPHHHFICTKCGRIDDISLKRDCIENCVPRQTMRRHLVHDYHLVFYGLCADSRKAPE